MAIAYPRDVAQYAGMYREGFIDIDVAMRMTEAASRRAVRKAKAEITSDEYDDITTNKAEGDADYDDLQEAEALLIAYYALPAMNMRMTRKGGLQRRTGTVDNENDLMSYSEMDAYRQGWFSEAMDILDTLAPTDSDESEHVYAG